jgi:hypothetical protein
MRVDRALGELLAREETAEDPTLHAGLPVVLLPYKETLSLPCTCCLPLGLASIHVKCPRDLVASLESLSRCTSGIVVLARHLRNTPSWITFKLVNHWDRRGPWNPALLRHTRRICYLSLSLTPTLPSTTTQHTRDNLNHTTTTHDKHHGNHDSTPHLTYRRRQASRATHSAPSTPVSAGLPVAKKPKAQRPHTTNRTYCYSLSGQNVC